MTWLSCQLTKKSLGNVELVSDVQYIRDLALSPDADDLWVFGLRARLAF